MLYGSIATLAVSVNYVSTLPVVHWRVNQDATIQSSVSYSGTRYTSYLMWPVTEDIEIETTVHHGDLGGYTKQQASVYTYGLFIQYPFCW